MTTYLRQQVVGAGAAKLAPAKQQLVAEVAGAALAQHRATKAAEAAEDTRILIAAVVIAAEAWRRAAAEWGIAAAVAWAAPDDQAKRDRVAACRRAVEAAEAEYRAALVA